MMMLINNSLLLVFCVILGTLTFPLSIISNQSKLQKTERLKSYFSSMDRGALPNFNEELNLLGSYLVQSLFIQVSGLSLSQEIYSMSVLQYRSSPQKIRGSYIGSILTVNLTDANNALNGVMTSLFVTQLSFVQDHKLQHILNNSLSLLSQRNLPLEKISISLIQLGDQNCCKYAGFNDTYPRFPASIAKLFWLVYLYSQYNDGILSESAISETEIRKMMADSDNEPASQVLDLVTQTESGESLSQADLGQWMDKRLSVNRYFESLGYYGINVSQKNFPVPFINLYEPKGRDLQMRGDPHRPIRNYLTTLSTARLLYNIHTRQAVSTEYSDRIKSHLRRDLNPAAWQKKPFNSIDGFLGESLPPNTEFYSKAGWMSSARNDAAIIISPDGRTQYILVIFGDDVMFKEDEDIFPRLSQQIYSSLINQP